MTQASPARRAARRGDRAGPPEPGGRYGLLLLLLISTYLLSAFSLSKLAEPLQVVLFAAVLLLALRTSPVGRKRKRLLGAVALIGSVAAEVAALSRAGAGEGAAAVWKGLILLLTAVLIVRRVLARPTVTLQSIYGALSAYLIIGLMFAAFYAAMENLGKAAFFASGETASTQTFQYFSFTTLTTLGYGDFTAAGNGGRAMAVVEALVGQVFLATLVARLVAAFRGPAGQTRSTATEHSPPRTAARAGKLPYRRRPAGNAIRISSRTSSSRAGRRKGANPRVPRPGQ